jgi:uncharacterized protein (DUF427 family)
MPKATWNGAVIAEAGADEVRIVEGNIYFPRHALHQEFLQPSSTTTQCPWKGTANYFDVVVNGERNAAAAWVYRNPSEAAQEIAEHVAFWHGVEVER